MGANVLATLSRIWASMTLLSSSVPTENRFGPKTYAGALRIAEDMPLPQSPQITDIGIDAEPNNPIESEIYSLIMSKKEIKQMGELTCSQPNISWDRLTFSAKESVYKAWFPTYGKWLDFTDCEVMFYLDSHRPNNQPKELVVGRYHAQLLKSKRSYSCNGQWAFVPFFNLLITTTAGSLTES